MVKKLSALVLALSLAFPTLADVLKVRNDAPQEYVVKKGDTLWDISAIYLDEPWLWPKLWRLNPQIDNPHLIYPGDKLSLVYDANGRPMLVMNQKYKKLSPTVRKTLKKDDAIPTLPLELIRPYLTYEQAFDEEYMDSKPTIIGADDNVKNMQPGQIVYVKGDLERSRHYAAYRKGRAFIDPETEEVLAHEAVFVGTMRTFRNGDIENAVPSSARLKNVKREVKRGDFVLPALEGQTLPAFFEMTRPEANVAGTIISTPHELREIGKLEVVVINRGTDDSIKAGNILDIMRKSPKVILSRGEARYEDEANSYDKLVAKFGDGEESNTWNMPSEKVGELMVFRTYDRVSYAIILKTLKPIRVGDKVSVEI